MRFLSAVMALALLAPAAANAAKDHSIELKCEKLKVTVYDKKGAIFIDSIPAKGEPSKMDNIKIEHTEMMGSPVIKTQFVEYPEMGGTYGLYNLYTYDNGQPPVLTSEWLNADDQPMRPIRSYECSNPVEKMQAMPNIQSIGEMRGW
ncbi:hypothetical protein [Enterobacter kobei]|uniref:hypothetical protein n=1 Tax=Enterobacter kobei TaxID=208224 RepID=UPI0021C1688C|nr:hypothetical protein [Enterobacter kobei]UXJ66689.1 hypothetical protein N5P26_22725 [Enterobacter kobei]